MKKYSLKACTVFMLLVMAGTSFALSADDFIPPVQEDDPAKRAELLAVKDDSAVSTEHDEALNADVTTAPTLQDAINKLIAKPHAGCQIAGVSGAAAYTLVSTGQGLYNPNHKNAIASRIEQRNAYVRAFMDAKGRMAAFLSEVPVQGLTKFDNTVNTLTDSERSLSNITTNLEERGREVIPPKVLKGYVTYSVFDDGKGKVFVTLVSSPKTRSISRTGEYGITAPSLKEGLNSVIAEIKKGLIPPVGGRIIEVPGTGETAWVGFGSSIVRYSPEEDVQAELELQAERVAELRAVDGLAGILFGDTVRMERNYDENTRQLKKNYDELQRTDPVTGGTVSEIREYENHVREMRNTLSSSEAIKSIRNNILPPGIMRHTEIDEDSYFAYGIAVYVPSASERVITIIQSMDNHIGGTPPEPDKPSPEPDPNLKMKRGPSGVINQDLD
ncbi:MAG: hypothetical protein IJS28_05855 [Synergistaceae bacterium]|nr:hypothetical protein [Synergistaceae bacterium]